MKLFTCAACQQLLFFENTQCGRCGHTLAYLPEHQVLGALEPVQGNAGLFSALAPDANITRYRLCGNYVQHNACNWAVPESDANDLCRACRLNETIPDLSDPALLDAWRRLEAAKRRLLYTLIELGLPLEGTQATGQGAAQESGKAGLAFEFKRDVPGERVFTGHDEGVITINVAEADAPFRERMREQMGEAYRTLLGHFRHEIGHYYWMRLVENSGWHQPFRQVFSNEHGDETQDYAQAMARHYAQGAPADWNASYVSSYASSHPWEDWAESFAHYLHMVDTLETARSHGLSLEPRAVGGAPLAEVKARRLRFEAFDDLIRAWFPLTISLNNFNRGMGLPDLYPFVLSERAVGKLRFIHEIIEAERR